MLLSSNFRRSAIDFNLKLHCLLSTVGFCEGRRYANANAFGVSTLAD
ncbi:hypothetical protein [Chamaesiphon polymorphus]|nr:hypothetical protein [Chamaesiphon polymorphus]